MTSRETLRARRRRIVWNDDGDDLNVTAHWNAAGAEWHRGAAGYEHFPNRFETVDDFLRQRMKGKIEGTQVDTIVYCGYTSVPNWEFPTENTRAIGPDPLKHAVDFAHANGMEFIYSFRMNDIHLSAHRASWLWSQFRMDHLELLQGRIDREWFEREFVQWMRGEVEKHPLADLVETASKTLFPWYDRIRPTDFRTWAAFDFGHREVRDYYLGLVREACRRYDLDGIEFDWGRTPPFFRSQHRANAPVMTDFIRQVRQGLDGWGGERGRPILFATRVPDSPIEALDLGLDAGTWLREGVVDLLVAGFGAKPFSFPIGEWVALAHERGVPVYGCIENGLPGQGKKEIIRATAERYWDAGADGVYLYNQFYEDVTSFPPGWPAPVCAGDVLYDIGDPARLRKLDRTYWVDMYGGDVQLPVRFSTESGCSVAVLSFDIAAVLSEASRVTLQVHWATDVDVSRISYRLNGEPLAGGESFVMEGETDNQGWYRYAAPSLRTGENTLEVTARASNAGPDKLLLKQVRAAISYEPG